MNLYITAEAKQKQIAYLVTLDNRLSGKYREKAGQFLNRVKQYIKKTNARLQFNVEEGQNNRVELYNGGLLVAYYTSK
jgi:hypothetical protein